MVGPTMRKGFSRTSNGLGAVVNGHLFLVQGVTSADVRTLKEIVFHR